MEEGEKEGAEERKREVGEVGRKEGAKEERREGGVWVQKTR